VDVGAQLFAEFVGRGGLRVPLAEERGELGKALADPGEVRGDRLVQHRPESRDAGVQVAELGVRGREIDLAQHLVALLHFLDGGEPARIVAADLPDTTGHPDQAAATRAAAGQATATQADGQTAVGRTAATRAAAELYETLVGPFTLRPREQVTA
jgi:hypothetical protein